MDLTQLRTSIDAIDDQLLQLLEKRMELVHQVGVLKHSNGESIYRPEREKSILQRLSKQNALACGRLSADAIEAIFLEIFAVSRNLEKPENIAFLGPAGSFTHQAAESRFGSIAEYVSMSTIAGVFKAVESGQAKFGVIPIENNIEGVVAESIDLLGKTNIKIVAELSLKIHHCLASRAVHLNELERIYSKDVAFGQCREFLRENSLDAIELIPTSSTAKAAAKAQDDPKSAAICSHIAAKLNNLPVLFENIGDTAYNETRFLIVSDFANAKSGNDKSSILVRLDDKPGTLAQFLSSFEKEGINLTKIESRPAKDEGFSYIFYIDFEGHIEDEKIKRALQCVEGRYKWLGSYVKGV